MNETINIVLSAKISGDKSVKQKINDALSSLYLINYEELTDDVWAAIKLLQKAEKDPNRNN